MRVLVTGGFGNIGSHLVAELCRRGHEVRVLDRRTVATRRRARTRGVEVVWGSVTDRRTVDSAVAGVDVVMHLAAVIPPGADERPVEARATNVDGTATIIAACQDRPAPPRLLFTSTFDVHGYTQDRPPPRRVDDPLVPTDPYSAHKIECEAMVRASGLRWCIVRLADVPVLGMRRPPAIMFEIGPEIRIEALHGQDAALALVNALDEPRMWGQVHFIGGGATCQVTYREYVTRLLAAMGIGALPDGAFRTGSRYATDWLDTADSESLLGYQRHSFDDIVRAVAANAGWKRRAVAAIGPVARFALLSMSPYYRRRWLPRRRRSAADTDPPRRRW
jgi:nucleoside-diphosphate-sugar epimerase